MNRTLGILAVALAATPLFAADAPKTAEPAKTAAAAPAAAAPAAPAAKPAAAKPAKAAKAAPSADSFKNDDERTAYAYGYKVGQNLAPLGMTENEVKILAQGLREAAAGKEAAVNMSVFLPKVPELIQKHVAVKAEAEKKKGAAFAEKFSKEAGVKPVTGGAFYKEIAAGKGAQPSADDTVKVNYRGTLIDGTEFDSSYKRNEPATFPLKGVIPCWTNGVAMMKVGGKAKLVCPSDAAYGDGGHPPVIPGGATLIFEVELLDIVKDAPSGDEKSAPKPASKK